MKKTFTKSLLLVAALALGSMNAWAESLIFTEDFSGETYKVTWGGTSAGGISPSVVDGVLKVANGSQTGDRSAYIAFGENAYTGCCRLTFDMAMTKSNWSGKSNYFYVLPSATTNRYPSNEDAALVVTQDYQGNITIAGEAVGGYDGTTLTYDLYLNTVTGTAKVIVKKGDATVKTISYTTTATGINTLNLQFNKNFGAFAIDNIAFYSLTAPAFTLSETSKTVSVGGTETVSVTGITGDISVTSNNEAAATATYADGMVTITGVASGVAVITVTATNDGLTTTQTIDATVGSVSTTTVTINYKDNGGNTIKASTTIDDAVVGSILTASDITYDDVIYGTGYRYVNPTLDQTLPYTVEENGVINITYTAQAAVTSVKKIVKAGDSPVSSEDVAQDGKYVGDVIHFSYPIYINNNGTLYSKAANGSSTYSQSFTLTGTDQECVLAYTATDINRVVYHSEGENIAGATATSAGTNMSGRSSNQQCGYAGSDIPLIDLPVGKYKATLVLYANSSGGATLKFKFGDEEWDAVRKSKSNGEGSTNWTSYTHEFTLSSPGYVKWLTSGNTKDGLDFIYIQAISAPATIPASGYATFAGAYALDLASLPDGLTAYAATDVDDSKVTLTEATTAVPAGEGLLLNGAAGTYDIPVAGVGTAIAGNLLKGVTEPTALTANQGYVLSEGKFHPCSAGTLAAGKAYLNWSVTAPVLEITFADDAKTGIDAIQKSESAKQSVIYNLSGQRVAEPQKGLYIKDGKKFIVK